MGWFRDLGRKFDKYVFQPVKNTVEAIAKKPLKALPSILALATGNAWALPYINAGQALAAGAKPEDVLKAAAVSYVSNWVASGAVNSQYLKPLLGDSKFVQSVATGGIRGAVTNALQGQNIGEGIINGIVQNLTAYGLNQASKGIGDFFKQQFPDMFSSPSQLYGASPSDYTKYMQHNNLAPASPLVYRADDGSKYIYTTEGDILGGVDSEGTSIIGNKGTYIVVNNDGSGFVIRNLQGQQIGGMSRSSGFDVNLSDFGPGATVDIYNNILDEAKQSYREQAEVIPVAPPTRPVETPIPPQSEPEPVLPPLGGGITPGAGGETGITPGAGGETGITLPPVEVIAEPEPLPPISLIPPGTNLGGETGITPGAGGETGITPGAGGETGIIVPGPAPVPPPITSVPTPEDPLGTAPPQETPPSETQTQEPPIPQQNQFPTAQAWLDALQKYLGNAALSAATRSIVTGLIGTAQRLVSGNQGGPAPVTPPGGSSGGTFAGLLGGLLGGGANAQQQTAAAQTTTPVPEYTPLAKIYDPKDPRYRLNTISNLLG